MPAQDYVFSGKDMVLYVKDPAIVDDPYKLIGCQTSANIDSQTNVSETVTKCGTIKLPNEASNTAQLEGNLLKANSDLTILDGIEFRNYFNTGKQYDWKLAPQDPSDASNDLPVYTFVGSISQLTDTFPADGPATFSATIAITGEVEVEAYVAPTT